ncbi:Tetraspanin family-domain-containing protein [Lentinula boryana]|uniref:Tetraspanin family-domain-containing protein n=1 Tax=Lentinula boryana TaxID=40481 RepID=A0ABQ8QHF8_9AGAR|nr:Tetraspanin family-domain-containing protein [Lentinula boryana]
MISVVTVLCYGSGAMICAILTWFRTWNHADVMYVADNDILILITLAASILMFTAILGITGTLLNSRPILATYTLLLWPALISMLAVGYISYKRYAFSLDRKLNFSWSQYYTPLGRLMIQSSLRCCGYYDPLHEATTSNKCYPRTPLPGCKGKLYRFERENLSLVWSTAFSLVSLHLINILVALLCSNHVTNVFGKRITPKQYRLSEQDLKTDAEKIKSYIVEQVRPIYSRASSSTVFREDREERMSLLKDPARLA